MKRTILFLAIFCFVLSGAFAQLSFGVSVQQYFERNEEGKLPGFSEAWKSFQDGEGLYWGLFAEIMAGKLGVGFSFNNQVYSNDDPLIDLPDMWNYDANAYLAVHLFGGKAFIDPFAQIGVGQWGFGFVESSDPMMASWYMDYGVGLGLNIGIVGAFVKAMWNQQLDEPVEVQGGYAWEFPVMPFKWVFGAKVIL